MKGKLKLEEEEGDDVGEAMATAGRVKWTVTMTIKRKKPAGLAVAVADDKHQFLQSRVGNL